MLSQCSADHSSSGSQLPGASSQAYCSQIGAPQGAEGGLGNSPSAAVQPTTGDQLNSNACQLNGNA
eukprot:8438497-Alexandrium_andersonii.AAC.1